MRKTAVLLVFLLLPGWMLPAFRVFDGLPIPEACEVIPFGEREDGALCLAVSTGASGILRAAFPDGSLYHLADAGQEILWVGGIGSHGVFHVICREMDNSELMGFSVNE